MGTTRGGILANKIKEFMEINALNQTELAEFVGLSPSCISRAMRPSECQFFREDTIVKIAKAIGLDPKSLFVTVGNPVSPLSSDDHKATTGQGGVADALEALIGAGWSREAAMVALRLRSCEHCKGAGYHDITNA